MLFIYVYVLVCIITFRAWSADRVVGIGTMLRAWKVRGCNPGRRKYCSSSWKHPY